MWEILTIPRILLAVGIISLAWLVRFLYQGYHYRTLIHKLPGPPHSYVWGSLPCINAVMKEHPKRAAVQTILLPMKEKYKLGEYFYLDTWPFGAPILVMFSTDLLNQVTIQTSLPKSSELHEFVKHFGGGENLVSSEGQVWRKWRSAFNPGFSTSHIMKLVPLIVEQCYTFCDLMESHAKDEDLFRMEPATTKLTVDIIGKVILDESFDAQKGPNVLVDAVLSQVRWIHKHLQNPLLRLLDIRRPIFLWYNQWQMDRYLSKSLTERFASRAGRQKTKAVIDLALETYLKEVKGAKGSTDDVKVLDPDFKQAATANLKIFIFAGHDTTSSTICYAYYYLSRHPETLEKVRRELDEVFGKDKSTLTQQLEAEPHRLNQLEYMQAVIKEVLRLQAPASTVRTGYKGFILHDPKTGEAIPCTEDLMIYPTVSGYHRLPEHWGDPNAFRPERFLSSEGHNKDAWIPFSKGIRSCIGQELAMVETKIILAMTLRTFDFHQAYDEVEKLKGDGSGYLSETGGIQEQYGEPAYQIQLGTAKPREGMPCRLSLIK